MRHVQMHAGGCFCSFVSLSCAWLVGFFHSLCFTLFCCLCLFLAEVGGVRELKEGFGSGGDTHEHALTEGFGSGGDMHHGGGVNTCCVVL